MRSPVMQAISDARFSTSTLQGSGGKAFHLLDFEIVDFRFLPVNAFKIVVDILPMPNNSAAWVGVRKSLSLHLLLAAFVAVS